MAIDITTLGAANSYTNKHSGEGGTSDYSDLTNKPAINDVTLSGNKSSEDLGLQDALTFDDTPAEDSENPVTSDGIYKALGGKLNTLNGTSSDIGKLIIVDSDGNTIAISNILISDLVTIEDLHSAINGIFIVADELPTASEDTLGEIYLIPNGGEDPNVRDEYLTTRGGTEGAYTYAWERIGTTDIDLSGYVPTSRTIADIDLEDDITASELREALNVEDGAEANVQADWGQSSTAADDFIKNKPNIPSKVSDLENDSGFEANVQANWNEDDTSSDAYIQNKPTDMDVLKRIHFELDTPVAQNKCYKLFTIDGLHNSLYIHFNYSFGHAFENPVAGTAILRLEKGYPELIDRETSLLELISDSNTFTNNIDICTRYVEEDYNLEVYIHGGSLNGYEDINCDIISCSDSINMLVIPDQLEAAPQDYNPHTDNYIPIYSHRGQIDNKVDKVEGKGLSTNDYTTAEKNKLSGIASGAEVNVQTDWNQSDNTADDYLKNKPTLGTAAAKDVGSANGVAELDSSGKVPSSQLPSYVDDVIEGYYDLSTDRFYEEAAFTTVIPPEAGKSWVDVASNKSYRWTGSVYVRVDEGVQLGETASSAYRGDRGKTAYDHSQSAHARTDATKVEASSTNGNIKINGTDTNVYTHPGNGTNPHGTTASDVGLGNIHVQEMNTSDELQSIDDIYENVVFNKGFFAGSAFITNDSVLPSTWYNIIWIPHRSGVGGRDNFSYGNFICIPMSTNINAWYIVRFSSNARVQTVTMKEFSGSYNDLTNKPSIPTEVSDLTNDNQYINGVWVGEDFYEPFEDPDSPQENAVSISLPEYPDWSELLTTPSGTSTISTFEALNNPSTFVVEDTDYGIRIFSVNIPYQEIAPGIPADGIIINYIYNIEHTGGQNQPHQRQLFIAHSEVGQQYHSDYDLLMRYSYDIIGSTDCVFSSWKKITPDTRGTQTVSGNPITVTDVEPMNAESVKVELEPKQDLHGYDEPWAGGAGKNKLPLTVDGLKAINTSGGTWSGNTYTLNGVTFEVLTDSADNVLGVKVNGTPSENILYFTIATNISVTEASIYSWGSTYNWNDQGVVCEAYDGTNSYAPTEINGISIPTGTYTVRFAMSASRTLDNYPIYPMIRLSTESDATFEPYSNICPISGYSEVNVERVGKNLFDKTTATTQAYIRSSGAVYPNGNWRLSDYVRIEDEQFYTMSVMTMRSARYYAICFYDENKEYVSGYEQETEATHITVQASFDKPSVYARFCVHVENLNNYMLELGNQATTYEPYQGHTYTVSLGGTKYGGTLDVTEGGYSDEWGTHTLDYVSLEDGLFTASAPNNVKSDVFAQAKCNRMKTWASVDDLDDNYGIAYSSNTFYMKLPPECGTTASEVDDWLGENPVRVVYLKKTPSSVSTAPTDITLLENTNNISTDGTNITLKYQPNNVIGECKAYTDEQIEKHNPLNYSTDEKAVGTWIDGKTIWQKTISASGLQLRDVETPIHLGDDVENVIRVFGRWKRSDNTYGVIPQSHSNNTFCIGMCDFTPYTKNMNIVIGSMNNLFYLTEYDITIQYTKV